MCSAISMYSCWLTKDMEKDRWSEGEEICLGLYEEDFTNGEGHPRQWEQHELGRVYMRKLSIVAVKYLSNCMWQGDRSGVKRQRWGSKDRSEPDSGIE